MRSASRLLTTLGIGALAVMAIACSSAAARDQDPADDATPPVGTPAAPEQPDDGGDDSDVISPDSPPDGYREIPADVSDVVLRRSGTAFYADMSIILPNGCIEPAGYRMEREGDTFLLEAISLEPTADELVCTQAIGHATYSARLGDGLEQGRDYTVSVNGEEALRFQPVADGVIIF